MEQNQPNKKPCKNIVEKKKIFKIKNIIAKNKYIYILKECNVKVQKKKHLRK